MVAPGPYTALRLVTWRSAEGRESERRAGKAPPLLYNAGPLTNQRGSERSCGHLRPLPVPGKQRGGRLSGPLCLAGPLGLGV
jgi:hypothetical protein